LPISNAVAAPWVEPPPEAEPELEPEPEPEPLPPNELKLPEDVLVAAATVEDEVEVTLTLVGFWAPHTV